jgi:hypothetical protein
LFLCYYYGALFSFLFTQASGLVHGRGKFGIIQHPPADDTGIQALTNGRGYEVRRHEEFGLMM